MNKAFKYQLKPTPEEAQCLAQMAGNNRWLWNHMLALNIDQYNRTKTFSFKYDMQARLPKLKQEHPWLLEATASHFSRDAMT